MQIRENQMAEVSLARDSRRESHSRRYACLRTVGQSTGWKSRRRWERKKERIKKGRQKEDHCRSSTWSFLYREENLLRAEAEKSVHWQCLFSRNRSLDMMLHKTEEYPKGEQITFYRHSRKRTSECKRTRTLLVRRAKALNRFGFLSKNEKRLWMKKKEGRKKKKDKPRRETFCSGGRETAFFLFRSVAFFDFYVKDELDNNFHCIWWSGVHTPDWSISPGVCTPDSSITSGVYTPNSSTASDVGQVDSSISPGACTPKATTPPGVRTLTAAANLRASTVKRGFITTVRKVPRSHRGRRKRERADLLIRLGCSSSPVFILDRWFLGFSLSEPRPLSLPNPLLPAPARPRCSCTERKNKKEIPRTHHPLHTRIWIRVDICMHMCVHVSTYICISITVRAHAWVLENSAG